jgi:hypothetical protein
MAEVITCTVYKVVLNGVGPKKYLAKFPAMRGVIKCHERLDDSLLFTLISTKRTLVKGKTVQKKTSHHFAIRYDSLEEERPFELHGKTATVSSKKIEVA